MKKPSVLSQPYFNGWHIIVLLTAVIAINTAETLEIALVVLWLTTIGLLLSFEAKYQFINSK